MEPEIAKQEERMQAALADWHRKQLAVCNAARAWDERHIHTSEFALHIYREREAERKYNLEMRELNRLCRKPRITSPAEGTTNE